MSTADFARLLAAAQDGDETAFTTLFRAVQPALLRYLTTMTRNLADGTADDVAAETWLQVVRGLRRFRGDEVGFRSWVFTIARARLVDARRRAGRLPVPYDMDELLAEVAGGTDVGQTVEAMISTEAALATIRMLPASQAEVVLLRYVAGFDVEHTARLVGKRSGAVRVTAHRALRRLEELMGGPVQGRDVTPLGVRTVR